MADFLRLVICFCLITSLKSHIIYITPNSGPEDFSCTTDKILLSPCYTINQIIKNEVLIATNESKIELNFLPGTHVMKENTVLDVTDFAEVTLEPWNKVFYPMINCQPGSELVFNSTGFLRIHFLHFLSCSLSCYYPKESVYLITNVFEESKGYAISIIYSIISQSVTISNSTFFKNHGAVALRHSHPAFVTFPHLARVLLENSKFEDNTNIALDVISARMTINYTDFTNNSAMEGGGIKAQYSLLALHYTTFTNNKAHKRGGSIFLDHSDLEAYDCYFVNNIAGIGGAITNTAKSENFILIYRSIFDSNEAKDSGGALHLNVMSETAIEECTFQRNCAQLGGAMSIEGAHCNIQNTSFISNEASGNGGAVYFTNDADHACPCQWCCQLWVEFSDFRGNTAKSGGGIFASQSTMVYKMTTVFTKNRATKHGGALALHASKITIDANATLNFNKNAADCKGGAMFMKNSCEQVDSYDHQCFITIEDSFNFTFESNTAIEGKDIYGGLLDRCKIKEIRGIELFSQYVNTSQAIMSDPSRVCLCGNDSKPDCKIREKTFQAPPGDYIEVNLAIVDQNMNPTSSTIAAEYKDRAELDQGERNQNTSNSCLKLSYHVFSDSPSEKLILERKTHCKSSNFSSITVHIRVLACPRGFEQNKLRCVCERRITKFTESCNVRTGSVERNKSIWLRYDEKYLKVSNFCPLSYCNLRLKSISLQFPNKQCASYRSGVLCGACQENYSIAFGSFKCIKCTTYAFAWLVPVFAVAGVALVAFMLICNINISHGTINGLIFYANVVSISELTSFQNCSTNPILTVFIAWLNLDFGFETCFYPGMNTYQKTWLQFAFPLYIWLLVGGIILASHYSASAMKLFGRNNIAMLATLFLLSYTKLLKTIVTILTFTRVLRGEADNTNDQLVPYYVWLYDGNIDYLKGKHMPLFFISLVTLLFLFLPYTLLLTFGQFLHLIPRRRNCILKFIHSSALVSIMDVYHAPYTKRHRYWTGLLLLSRCALIFAFFTSYKESNMLALAHITILVLIAILTLKATCALKVYKNTFIAILEVSFLVNLLILSYFLNSSGESDSNACKHISASISISLVTFVGILGYHAYLQIRKTVVGRTLKKIIFAKKPTKQLKNNATSKHPADILPTSTSVELRESLLDNIIADF